MQFIAIAIIVAKQMTKIRYDRNLFVSQIVQSHYEFYYVQLEYEQEKWQLDIVRIVSGRLER